MREKLIGQVIRQGQHITGIGQHEFGIAAIGMETGETRLRAQIFFTAPAKRTLAAGRIQPGHTHTLTDAPCRHPRSQRGHPSHHLVTGRNRVSRRGDFPFHGMQVGMAHTTHVYPQQHLTGPRLRNGEVIQLQGVIFDRGRAMQTPCSHTRIPPASHFSPPRAAPSHSIAGWILWDFTGPNAARD